MQIIILFSDAAGLGGVAVMPCADNLGLTRENGEYHPA